ncbi:MAG: UvrD-helicase domain-containing protein [Syntrophales bacterium]
MQKFEKLIDQEEDRCREVVSRIKSTLAAEDDLRREKSREIKDLQQKQLVAEGWREKREIGELIGTAREQNARRLYQDDGIMKQPYFAILEIDDAKLGARSYCLGRQSFFDSSHKVLILDWRDAPISRLYYEYEEGEIYEEMIRGKERTGTVAGKRQVDTPGGELHKIVDRGILLVRQQDGTWRQAGAETAVSRKEQDQDHRLPEITSLISREQFRAITQPDSGTILLQGGAGSGKTTVGLHRIAYLAYQNSEHFLPQHILVVMFNRSLQQYISRVLPDLGLKAGVKVETFHSWAGKVCHQIGIPLRYEAKEASQAVTRLKKHPLMLPLIERYLEGLLEKSRAWLLENLPHDGDDHLGKLVDEARKAVQFDEFFRILLRHQEDSGGNQSKGWRRVVGRLVTRLSDHQEDLHAMLTDRQLLQDVFSGSTGVPKKSLDQLVDHQALLKEKGLVDFADAGLLVRLLQLKGVAAAHPGYAHVMVDEAQDLSQVELATLLAAADDRQCVTMCGDMAQKIKGEVTFASPAGFAHFIQKQQKRLKAGEVQAETLMVGYRATWPIMEAAWKVLNDQPTLVVARDGLPVQVVRTSSYEETIAAGHEILADYRQKRPQALVAVVCRYIADANQVFADLQRQGLKDLRRQARQDFSFQPGVVVTNAHQVKGLEFSAVMVINPTGQHYRDNRESRMLLHVVFTRAADNLWIVGHQPMAYGLENL